jgi:phosphatidylglycerophosphate synthase
VALVAFIFAMVTDFLDGLSARKFRAYSKFGEELDPLADASLVAAGFLALSFGGVLDWRVTIAVLAVGGLIGSERFFVRPGSRTAIVFKVLAVSSLFVEWVFISLVLAAQAFGWSWWYVLLALVILLAAASLKRHRLRSWLGLDGAGV